MIDKFEILQHAQKVGLEPRIVEKDYVLGWLLWGIYNSDKLRDSWIFKGGTCLKKCFFETYRFSEDLDFTLIDATNLNLESLNSVFVEISSSIYEICGLSIPTDTIKFEIYSNPEGRKYCQGRLGYRGPIAPGGDLPRIKLDLTGDEVIVTEPVTREVYHPYSDRPPNGITAHCYTYEELLAEKTRALAERARPRDLYDVIFIFHNQDLRPNLQIVNKVLTKKCEFKSIPVPDFNTIDNHPAKVELVSEWGNMLGHQLPHLPLFDSYWSELSDFFDWITGTKPIVLPQPYESPEPVVRPSIITQQFEPMERIKFAAASRLCVNLLYDGTQRLIEPYSLRRSSGNRLLLYAIKHDTGETRAYRLDRIEGAEVTNVQFNPRYAIELGDTSTPIGVPMLRRFSISGKSKRKSRRTYEIECYRCHRRFSRSKRNTKLRKHKDKMGNPCFGRSGKLVGRRN